MVLVPHHHCYLVSLSILPEHVSLRLLTLICRIASGGISTFGNLIIKDFGYTNFQAILFNIPFGAIQVCVILGSSWGATRFKRKGLAMALVCILPIIGTVMMLTVPRKHKGALLFGYYLVSCLAAITPIIYTWHIQNTAGDTKKKCTSAMVFIGMCTGNVIGPLLYSVDDAPLYRPGLISNLVMFILVAILSLLIPIYLALLNKRHAKRREALGKSAVRIDESMMKKEEMTQGKGIELEETGDAPRQEADNGFSDLTDMQNEDFIYVY
jgi:MFS family permease